MHAFRTIHALRTMLPLIAGWTYRPVRPTTKVFTLSQARDMQSELKSSMLIAIRILNPSLLDEAVLRAHTLGEKAIYLSYVERSRTYPEHVQKPSEGALRLLADAAKFIEKQGIRALPIWQFGENPGKVIAETTRALGIQTVIIGTAKRRALASLFQLRFLKSLRHTLPPECHLIVFG